MLHRSLFAIVLATLVLSSPLHAVAKEAHPQQTADKPPSGHGHAKPHAAARKPAHAKKHAALKGHAKKMKRLHHRERIHKRLPG